MKRIYITSLIREPKEDETAGYFYVVDWDSKEIIDKIGLPIKQKTIGGLDSAFLPNYEVWVIDKSGRLYAYDPEQPHQGLDQFEFFDKQFYRVANQPTDGIHQIKFDPSEEYLYIACARSDYLVRYDYYSNPTSTEIECLSKTGLPTYREWGEDNYHFNSIAFDDQGDMYHTYYAANCVYNWTKKKVFYESIGLNQAHDIEFNENYAFVSSSANRNVVALDRSGNFITTMLESSKFGISAPKAELGYTRGLALTKDGEMFSCCAPGYIRYARFGGRLIDKIDEEFIITIDLRETIYDIILDKRDWNV